MYLPVKFAFSRKKCWGVAVNNGLEGGRFKSGPFLYIKYKRGIRV